MSDESYLYVYRAVLWTGLGLLLVVCLHATRQERDAQGDDRTKALLPA